MAIEIWNGSNWIDVDDPEICTSTAGSGTFVNIQRGQIWTGSTWETFYIRSVGNGGTAAAPIIALSDKSSRRIRITVSHTNTTGDNVIVLAYIDNTSPPNILSPINTQIHPNTGYTTTTYSGQIETFGSNTYNSILNKNTTYYIGCVAQFYNSSNSIIKSVSGNTLTVATYDYAGSLKPGSITEYKTSTSIVMITGSNAFNNGNCWMQWEYQRRIAGSGSTWVSVGTINDSSNPLVDNDSGEFKAYNFTSLNNDYEHRFRARIVYSGLGNSNSEIGNWSEWSNNIRPLYLAPVTTGVVSLNNTTYFNPIGSGYSNSQINATSTLSGYNATNASDNDTNTVWINSPSREYSEEKTIASSERDGSYVYYYASSSLTLDEVDDAKILNISKLEAIFIQRYTYDDDSGRKSELRSISSTNYPFDANDYVTIAGSSVGGVNGTRAVNKRVNNYTLRFGTSGVASTTSGFVSDSGTLTGETSGGNSISNLNTPGSRISASKDSPSGVKIATASIGSTRTYSLSNVLGSSGNTPTMYLRGRYYVGYGEETLHAHFSVKSNYLSPRMTTSNYIKVTNGDIATYIDIYLNGSLIESNKYFAANASHNIYPPSTIYANYGSEFIEQDFYVRLDVDRQSTAFGWYAKIAEVGITFTYSAYTDDGVV